MPGGARRPAGAPALVAWRVIRRSRSGALPPVVGRCEACGMPMVGAGEPIPWEIATPLGKLAVSTAITGPNGPMTDDEADRFVEDQLAEKPPSGVRYRAGQAVVVLVVVVILGIPIGGWLFAATMATSFIFRALPLYKPF